MIPKIICHASIRVVNNYNSENENAVEHSTIAQDSRSSDSHCSSTHAGNLFDGENSGMYNKRGSNAKKKSLTSLKRIDSRSLEPKL